jgi:mannose-6-phosphate isomerase
VDLLEPVIQPYAWGSSYAIAEIQGRPTPSPGPEAELWMGAHQSSPSGVERDGLATTLDAVIAADPIGELGQECVDRFGPRLPFLLKILAAEKALSIQVHPDRSQAEAGFQAENDRGMSQGDPARNYVDDWPKPEVLCALTPFEALAGFRDPREAADLLETLEIEDLNPLAVALRASKNPSSLTGALGRILGWPQPARAALLDDVVAACARVAAEGGSHAGSCDAAVRISADHPADIGVLASLLFEHLVLQPGEALFMPAGGLHAYVRGVGVELLANSDNVLRAGLTSKHMDVAELLRIVDPSVAVPVLQPREVTDSVVVYDTPVPEFRLYRLACTVGDLPVPGDGPRIVLCLDGEAELRDASGTQLKLGRGHSCFLPAADGPATAAGLATLVTATPG